MPGDYGEAKQYNYQAGGILDRPKRDYRGSQKEAISKAYSAIGDVDVKGEWDKAATDKLYLGGKAATSNDYGSYYANTGGGVLSNKMTSDTLKGYITSLDKSNIKRKTRSGADYRKIDKNIIRDYRAKEAKELALMANVTPEYKVYLEGKGRYAGSSYDIFQGAGGHKYSTLNKYMGNYKGGRSDPNFLLKSIMESSTIHNKKSDAQYQAEMQKYQKDYRKASRDSWSGDIDIPRPSRYTVDKAATNAQFNKTLDEMLADKGTAYYANYAYGGKKGSYEAYNDLRSSLSSGAKGSKDQFMAATRESLATERAKVDIIVQQNKDRVANREKVFNKLFNQGGKKRYL